MATIFPLPVIFPLILIGVPGFLTTDGQPITYEEGTEALRTGRAILMGGFFVGHFGSSYAVPYNY